MKQLTYHLDNLKELVSFEWFKDPGSCKGFNIHMILASLTEDDRHVGRLSLVKLKPYVWSCKILDLSIM